MTDDPVLDDPVLARRARIGMLAETGKRVGYSLFGLAVVGFVIGFVVGFRGWLVNLIIGALIVGSLILAPAIVFSYAVAATDREEQGGTYGH